MYQQSTIIKEIKKAILFVVASKKIKFLGINLTKEVKDLHTEHYKALLNETKEDLYKWKDILCSCIGRLHIVKMSILPKAIHRFNTISIKIQADFFHSNGAANPQIHMKLQGAPNSQYNLEKKKNKVERLKLCNFETQHKATIIKKVRYWQKKSHTDSWNGIECLEVNPYFYSQLIFIKGTKGIIYLGKGLF